MVPPFSHMFTCYNPNANEIKKWTYIVTYKILSLFTLKRTIAKCFLQPALHNNNRRNELIGILKYKWTVFNHRTTDFKTK